MNYKHEGSKLIIIIAYVNDIILIGDEIEEIERNKKIS